MLQVAIRGAVLYFILADLAIVDVMYQFSLGWFQEQFINCINLNQSQGLSSQVHLSGTLRPSSARKKSHSPRSEDGEMSPKTLQEHMRQMIDRLTWSIYRVVSVALFAHHQLTFSFMITTAILMAEHTYGSGTDKEGITMTEYNTFLQGSIMASLMKEETLQMHNGLTPIQVLEVQNKQLVISPPKWVTASKWRQCQHLEATFPAFEYLCQSLVTNYTQWDLFAMSQDPFTYLKTPYKAPEGEPTTTSEGWDRVVFPWQNLSRFQHLLLLKVLRPDTIMAAVRQFVEEQMGSKFVSFGTFDIREMFESSSAKTPLIFILSPGSDPGAQLLRFAKELRGSTLHLDMISLGRGQGPKAEELIAKAQILKGRWLFLQNCHLAASWMPRLQTIVDSFNKPGTDVDPQFRMWLSSKPDPNFPISILQTGLKMTVEPPQGVKSNLLRLYTGGGTGAVTERVYEETCPDKPAWKNLLFGLCFFNAVIHERKKYGRLGWNIPYEFNDSDLEVSVLQLQMLMQEQYDIPWPALWYLTGEVTYGGRVTDDMDRRCLHRLLQRFYHPRALNKNYTYSPDKLYHPVPSSFSFSDVRAYIEQLPASDNPELFGMNENAEKAHLESQANTLVETVLNVQPRLSTALITSGGRSSDTVVLDLAQEILNVLPECVEPEEEEPQPGRTNQISRPSITDIVNMGSGLYFKLRKRDSAKPNKGLVIEENSPAVEAIRQICQSALFVVLRQEMDRFNNLLRLMHKSLKLLLLGVKGEVVMSQNLEEAYNAMLKQKVPLQWTEASYESCKPLGPWVSDLVQRVEFFSEWVDLVSRQAEKILKTASPSNGPPSAISEEAQANANLIQEYLGCIQPHSFWLSAFFFPQGFLTAVQQSHARKIGVSVDSLTFHFTVINRSNETDDSLNDTKRKLSMKELGYSGSKPPEDGVMVFGLFLDGARWNLENSTLCDSLPGQRFSHLPQIHFKPIIEETRQATSSALESPLAMFKSRPDDQSEVQDTYECPLYRTSTRAGTLSSTGHSTNFVTSVSLPTDKPAEFWVMRGVALLCQLDD